MTRNMIGCLGPVHNYPYTCENVEFSIGSGLAYRPDVEDVSATRNIGLFRNGAQGGDWAGSSFTYACERTKTEGFEYDVFKVCYCIFIVSAFSPRKRFKAIKVKNGYERTPFFCFVLFWGGGVGEKKMPRYLGGLYQARAMTHDLGGTNKLTVPCVKTITHASRLFRYASTAM